MTAQNAITTARATAFFMEPHLCNSGAPLRRRSPPYGETDEPSVNRRSPRNRGTPLAASVARSVFQGGSMDTTTQPPATSSGDGSNGAPSVSRPEGAGRPEPEAEREVSHLL